MVALNVNRYGMHFSCVKRQINSVKNTEFCDISLFELMRDIRRNSSMHTNFFLTDPKKNI